MVSPDRRTYERDGLKLRCWENGIWRATWPKGNRQTGSISTGTRDFGAACAWLDQFCAGRTSPEPPPDPTVAMILDRYVADLAARGRPWAVGAGYAVETMRGPLGRLKPAHLTTLVIRRWVREERARGVAEGYIHKKVVSVLRPALKLALRDKLIDDLPAVEAVSPPPPGDRWLALAEIDRLACCARADHVFLYIVIAFHTAARRGAILALTWDRVDLMRRLLDLNEPGRELVRKRRAVVPINDTLWMALAAARPLAETARVIEYAGRPVASVKTGLRRAWRDSELKPASMPRQVLRHSAATHMAMAGVPLDQIADFLADLPATVHRVYRKFSPGYLADAAKALG